MIKYYILDIINFYLFVLLLIITIIAILMITINIFSNKIDFIENIHHLVCEKKHFRACREIARLLFIPSYPENEIEVGYAFRCLALNRALLTELEHLCKHMDSAQLAELNEQLKSILNQFYKLINNTNILNEKEIQEWNKLAFEFYKLKYQLLKFSRKEPHP